MTVQHTSDQSVTLFQITAKELAIPEDVLKKRYGIHPDYQVYISPEDRQKLIDKNNGILPDVSGLRIHYMDPQGRPYTYTKESTKTAHEGADRQPYIRKRHNPALIKAGLRAAKYTTPKGADSKLYFNALQGKGRTLAIPEGEKKAAYINYHFDIPACATSGISMPVIDQDSEKMLASGAFDNVILLYDSDMIDLSYNKELDTAGMPCTSRSLQFAASAMNASEQIFALNSKYGLKIKVHIAYVNPKTGTKGIDENKPEDIKTDIDQALKNFKSNDTLILTKVSKSNYKEKIKGILGLKSHSDFWEKHSEKIQNKPFLFFGAQYKKKAYNKGFFELLNDPHQIEIKKASVEIEKYISENPEDIKSHLDQYVSVIDAGTGTGKTTFVQSLEEKKILVLPYKSLALQVAQAAGKKALVGGVTRFDIEEAAKEDLIICVYDMLPALKDVIKDSILIMDEAHNLTKQQNIRADILKHIFNLITEKVPKKVILLSGTPDHLLSKVLQAKVIEVKTSHSNKVKVQPVIARSSSKEAYLEKTLDVCRTLDRSKLNIVFYNDKDSLDMIKNTLVKSHGWHPQDIAVISRQHIEANDIEYMEIIEDEYIKGAKLILTTVLIAEGINIKNENIGAVIMVKQYCPKIWRQFIARFRSMAELTVYDIKAPETVLMPEFFKTPIQRYIEERTEAQQQIDKLKKDEQDILTGLAPEDQAFYFIQQKEKRSSRKALTIKHIDSAEGRLKIDDLSIISQIDRDIINEANNAYFYTLIDKYAGIEIVSGEEPEACSHNIEEVKAELAEDRKAHEAQLIDDLKTRPANVIGACFVHYSKAGNREGVKFLNDHCPELIDTTDQTYQYKIENSHIFSSSALIELIRHYTRRHFVQMPEKDLFAWLDKYSKTEARSEWRAFEYQFENSLIYPKKHYRQGMDPVHRQDIKNLKTIKDNLGAGVVTLKKAKAVIRQVTGRTLKETQTVELLKTIFKVQAKIRPFELDVFDRYKDENGRWVRIEDVLDVPEDASIKIGIKAKAEKILILEDYPTIYPTAKVWQDIKRYIRVKI